MVWHEVALTGQSAGEFEAQLEALTPFLAQTWQARISERSGNPVYLQPDGAADLPRRPALPDRAVAAEAKARRAPTSTWCSSATRGARRHLCSPSRSGRIVAPLTRALGPGGRLLGVQGYGDDPGHGDRARRVARRGSVPAGSPSNCCARRGASWEPAASRLSLPCAAVVARHLPLRHARAADRDRSRRRQDPDLDACSRRGTRRPTWRRSRTRGWRRRCARTTYLDATRAALRRNRGLWFNDEMFVISRNEE
jgi:hypothetical protein